MPRCSALIVALWCGLFVSPSLAAPGPSDTAGTSRPQQSAPLLEREGRAPAEPTAARDIEQRYAAAEKLYMAGELHGALLILEECYEATHSANLLFNIAQLHREQGDCLAAIEHYRRYIAEAPDGERVTDARKYLESLVPKCAIATAPTSKPTPSPPVAAPVAPVAAPVAPVAAPVAPVAAPVAPVAAPDAPRPNYWSTLGWIALGTGALATAATVYASLETAQASRDVEHPKRTGSGLIDGELLMERQDDFYRNRAWAFGLGSAAVALTGFGIYALAFAAPGKRAPTHTVSASALPNRVSVDYGWRF